jgi:hypothetical protein
MNLEGLLFLLNEAGNALAQLRMENTQLRQQLEERDKLIAVLQGGTLNTDRQAD